eukprot:scaffold16745_cov92-Amphora_coffeaeformis.AAC.1
MKLFLFALLGFLLPTLSGAKVWNRIATFLVCVQDDASCNDDAETVSEIVSVTPDGATLVYTDSPGERL